MKITLSYFVALVAISMVGVGCKKGPVSTLQKGVALTAPDGWRLHTVTNDRITICAPVNWVTKAELEKLENPAGSLQDMMNGSGNGSMPQEPPLDPTTTTDTNLILMNRSVGFLPGEQRTSMAITVENVGAALLSDQAAQKKSALGSSITSEKTLHLPIGDCEEFVTKTVMINGDEVFERFYILCNNEQKYTVHFLTTNNEGSIQNAPEIMETFRLK